MRIKPLDIGTGLFFLNEKETVPNKFTFEINEMDISEQKPESDEKCALSKALWRHAAHNLKHNKHLPIISTYFQLTNWFYDKLTIQLEHSEDLEAWIRQGYNHYYTRNGWKHAETWDKPVDEPNNHEPITIQVKIFHVMQYAGLGTMEILQ